MKSFKQTHLFLLASCMCLAACAGTAFNLDFTGTVGNKPAEPEQKSCVAIDADLLDEPEPIDGILKIWGKRSKFWEPNQVITVRFLDGSRRQLTETRKRLDKLDALCGITLQYVDSGPALCRISFRGNGHWSYLGKDALGIPQNASTTNISLGQYTLNDPADEWDRVVYHEFLHFLGFDHEQSHPNSAWDWNKPVVYAAYMREQGWTKSQVDRQVLFRDPGKDPWDGTPRPVHKSIMQYPIPRSHLRSGQGVGWNSKLDPSDIAVLQQKYPQSVTHSAPEEAGVTHLATTVQPD